MTKLSSLVVLLLISISVLNVPGQTQGVHSEYMKSEKTTRVETSLLYVQNSPTHFAEVILRAWYKGEKIEKPPTKVAIEIFSISKKPMYEASKERSLVIVGDGVEWSAGNVSHMVMITESKKGVDTFYAVGGNPNIGMQIPVPPSAQIRSPDGSLNGLTLEWMGSDLKAEKFLKTAAAQTIELRLGKSVFKLTEGHVNIIHNFANAITVK